MNQLKGAGLWLMTVLILAGLTLTGCAGKTYKPGEVFSCVPDAKLDKTVAKEAELEEFSCMIKEWEGSNVLHFKVGIKNVSMTDQRYKVNIFLDNDKAVGGLIPSSTKKGLVKPGASAGFEYPVPGMAYPPKSIILMIKTLGD